MKEESLRVLLVEDEESLREPLAKRLRGAHDYQVDTAADATEAWQLVTKGSRSYDVVLIDDMLTPEPHAEPEPLGIELVSRIKRRYSETECIVFSGWGMNRALAALQAGVYRYLAKPFNLDELGMTIRMAAEQSRMRRERDLLSAILEISNAMVSGLDVARTLEVIAEAVPRLTGAEACAVAWEDPVTGRVHYGPVIPIGDATVQWQQHIRGVSLTRQIIETGQRFFLSDVYAHADEVDKNLRQAGVKSFVGMPIPGDNQNQGVLYAYSIQREAFGAYEQQVLELLAGQVAIALENTRLFDAEARRRREAETLRETAMALTTTLEPQEILERILTELQKVVPYDSASVQLLKENRLEIIGGRGFPNLSKIIGLSLPVDGDNPNREVIHCRDCFIVPDAPTVYENFSKEPHVQAGIRGWLGVPMLIGDRLIGMIALDKRQPGFYTEEHARLARAFATQAAIAIENSRLFSDLAETKEWREALIENAFDAVIAIDQNMRITVFNQRAEEMLGWTTREMIGHAVTQVYMDAGKAKEIYDIVNREGSVSGWEIELKHRDGTRISALLSATLLRGSDGYPIGQAGFIRDLRQMALLEERLRALVQVSQAITSTLELDAVLRRIMNSALDAFPTAQRGTLYLYDESADTLRLRANTFGYSPAAVEALPLRSGEGIAGWVFQHQQSVVVDDAQKDPRYKRINHPEVPLYKSMVCAPLTVRERVIGTLSLANLDSARAFQADDLGLLSTFSDQAAIAIENARLYEETRRHAEEMELLFDLGVALNTSLKLEEVLDCIAKSCQRLIQAETSTSVVYDERRNKYVQVGAADKTETPVVVDEPRPDGYTNLIMQTGEPIIISDVTQDKRAKSFLMELGVRSMVGVPIRLSDTVIGVLFVHSTEPHHFGEHEVVLLSFLANQAAIAINNARLFEEVKQRARNLETLRDLVLTISSSSDLDEMLRKACQAAVEFFDADHSGLALFDLNYVEGKVCAEYPPSDSTGTIIPLRGVEAEERLIETRRPLVVTDVVSDESLGPVRDILLGFDIQSILVVPVIGKNRDLLGSLSLDAVGHTREFTSEEVELCRVFAAHVAVAIENARLLEQVREARDVAKTVAEVSILEDLSQTLSSIVKGTRDVLGCDAVSLYTYDQASGKLSYPPSMIDVWHPERAARLPEVPRASIVFKMLERDEPYIVHDTSTDLLFRNLRFVLDEEIKSCAAMPLKVGDRKVGVMFVNFRSHHRFTGEELTDIELFANQAAVAIRNAQLYQVEQQHVQTLKAIQETSAAVSAVLELDDLLPIVTDKAADIFSAPAISLMLWDERRENLVIQAAYGLGDEYQQKQKIARSKVHELVEKKGLGPHIFDIKHEPIGRPELVKRERLCTALVAPLTIGNELIGVLNIYGRDEPRQFDGREIEVARIFANHAAIAIQNAREFRLRERLLKAGEVVTAEGELYPALKVIARGVKETIGCDVVSLYTYNQKTREISYPSVVVGELRKPQEQAVWQLVSHEKKLPVNLLGQQYVIGKLLANNRSHFAFCSAEDSILGAGQFVAREEIKSSAGILLKVGEEVVGILFVNYRSAHHFSEEEKQAAELFAVQAALTILSARRYEALKRIKGFVGSQTVLDWMRMVSTVWGHSIRREVGTSLVCAELVRQAIQDEEYHQALKELEDLETKVQEIAEIPITAPLLAEDAVTSVRVHEAIIPYLVNLFTHPQYAEVHLELDLDPDLDDAVTVRASKGWFQQGVEIVVDNAVQAMLDADSSQKQLSVTTRLTGDVVEILIRDMGPGIPADLEGKLFNRPIDKPKGSRGAGIGLMLAATIFEAYQGSIEVRNTSPRGTTIAILLPAENNAQ